MEKVFADELLPLNLLHGNAPLLFFIHFFIFLIFLIFFYSHTKI